MTKSRNESSTSPSSSLKLTGQSTLQSVVRLVEIIANDLRSFADAASPWEQTGAGDPNIQPEVSSCLLPGGKSQAHSRRTSRSLLRHHPRKRARTEKSRSFLGTCTHIDVPAVFHRRYVRHFDHLTRADLGGVNAYDREYSPSSDSDGEPTVCRGNALPVNKRDLSIRHRVLKGDISFSSSVTPITTVLCTRGAVDVWAERYIIGHLMIQSLLLTSHHHPTRPLSQLYSHTRQTSHHT